jgi:acetylornithine deacetylase/succinyl-diaminopimelate desuccinylase-like protein
MDIKNFLKSYVACRSVSSDSTAIGEMAKARDFLIQFFKSLSMEVKEVNSGLHAVVFAKTKQRSDRPTILVYGHYDVQPADDPELWISSPFDLTERNGRLYGRGASDNKGGHSAILLAVRDILTAGNELPVNLKFILEGEEEIGSGGMPNFLHMMKDELTADFALVADTWSLSEQNIVITTGLRGLVGCEVTLKGQDHDLHSGYGGCILNPIQAMVSMCAALHTPDGFVNIPGFYDEVLPISNDERDQMRRLPLTDDVMREQLGVKRFRCPDARLSAVETMRFLPTLEFNGIKGGFQGEGLKTIIPCSASTKITCRLVPNQNVETIKRLLESALTKLCPEEMLMSTMFSQSVNPYLIDIHSNENRILRSAMQLADMEIKNIFGNPPLYLRDCGSIGLVTMLKEILGIDSLLMGLTVSEDNIHAPNESIAISMLEKGRQFFKSFIAGFRV